MGWGFPVKLKLSVRSGKAGNFPTGTVAVNCGVDLPLLIPRTRLTRPVTSLVFQVGLCSPSQS